MELNVNDLGQVQDELFEARSKWYDIGLQLKVPVGTLDSIEIKFNDPKVQLRVTLKSWLQNTEGTTWETLVTTLENQTINESRLATKLKEKYCEKALVKKNKEHSEMQHLRQELETRNKQLQEKNQLLEASQYEIQQLKQEVARDHEAQESQAKAFKAQQALDQTEEVRYGEIQQLRHKLKERDWQSEIQQLKQELESRDRQLQAKDRQLQEKDEALVARKKEMEELRLEQHAEQAEKSPVTKKRRKNEDLYLQSREQSPAEDTSGIGKLKWKELLNVPLELLELQGASSAIIDGKMVYVSDNFEMYAYDLDKKEWITLQECKYMYFTLAVVKGQLTTIGGCDAKHQLTKSLLSLIKRRNGRAWSEEFPPMSTACIEPAVACSKKALIVAGGYTTLPRVYVHTHVEVMNIETKQWFTASRQLKTHSEWCTITIDITRDLLYIYTCATTPQTIVCSITDLLQSGSSQDDIWDNISSILAAKLTIAIIGGQLMAINSKEESNEMYVHVRLYDPEKDSWKEIGDTPTVPKEAEYVESFSGNGLIIVALTRAAPVTIFIPDFE